MFLNFLILQTDISKYQKSLNCSATTTTKGFERENAITVVVCYVTLNCLTVNDRRFAICVIHLLAVH